MSDQVGHGVAPPGWYPAPDGWVRWWDGYRWGPVWTGAPAQQPTDEKTMAVLAWVLCLVGGFVAPLIILVVKKEQPFVRHHAAQALAVEVVMGVVSLVAMVVWITTFFASFPQDSSADPSAAFFAGFGGVWLATMVLSIARLAVVVYGAVQAGRGSWWRLPGMPRFVTGVDPADPPYPVR